MGLTFDQIKQQLELYLKFQGKTIEETAKKKLINYLIEFRRDPEQLIKEMEELVPKYKKEKE